MKKIFIIIGSLGIGGTEKQLLEKIKYLKKKFDFTVIIFFRRGDLFNTFKKLGIKIIDLSSEKKRGISHYITVIYRIYSILKKLRPEIVNMYLPHSYLLAGFLSYIFPKQIFVMSRRSLNNYQKKIPFIRFFEKNFLHKKMTYILANSQAIKDELVQLEGVEKEKVKIIHNSVEINKIEKQKRKEIRILHIANLIPYKNHRLIIKACSEITSTENFMVDLVGDGALLYKNNLKEFVKKNDLANRILFHGKVRDYKNIVKYSDIGVLTSDEEGFSNAILEYMSLSLPVIATNVGGNSEIIDHNKNGFLVEKNDFKGLAKYLEILISDKELRKKFGKNGYNKVKQNFNLSRNMKKYEDLYDSILKHQR